MDGKGGWIEKREDRREHDRMDYLQKAFFLLVRVWITSTTVRVQRMREGGL